MYLQLRPFHKPSLPLLSMVSVSMALFDHIISSMLPKTPFNIIFVTRITGPRLHFIKSIGHLQNTHSKSCLEKIESHSSSIFTTGNALEDKSPFFLFLMLQEMLRRLLIQIALALLAVPLKVIFIFTHVPVLSSFPPTSFTYTNLLLRLRYI